jgi:3-aminobutyryl-CoA ammonia-lyase
MPATVGQKVTHRRYVSFDDSHYAGNLVDGAFVMKLFGDVATHLLIVTDSNEGLFASYSDVQFLEPVRGGDVIEVTARIDSVGTRSRRIEFEAMVLARSSDQHGNSTLLSIPCPVASAVGTVVVPATVG